MDKLLILLAVAVMLIAAPLACSRQLSVRVWDCETPAAGYCERLAQNSKWIAESPNYGTFYTNTEPIEYVPGNVEVQFYCYLDTHGNESWNNLFSFPIFHEGVRCRQASIGGATITRRGK